ncbi:MAG: preprotein translocase subunit SecA [Dehalococcoidia bacterium]|nr:preprotein translocase subunit SecA [Dehalococcoidia bacterium]
MLKSVTNLITGGGDRAVKRLRPDVEAVASWEPEFENLSDDGLRAKTDEFKALLAEGDDLDDIRSEAFAAVREAAKRNLNMRHFDVQIMGGVVLHEGKIAEMKTGEGKTLVATLPTYLNALTGRGVHVVTVNDYLAKRDAQWMGSIYHALGVSVATLQHQSAYLYDPTVEGPKKGYENLRPITRQEAYQADITYGTNSEFGFDYLRDAMAPDASNRVQRDRHYAIVDEVDNILIDEARTPLIISGPAEESAKDYQRFSRLVSTLHKGVDYTIDEKLRSVSLTAEGMTKLEKMLRVKNMYAPENFRLVHFAENALKAHAVYERDREYVVKDREVVIVDEFTGRMTPGRRFADGLHQAIEAKEGVPIQRESITYATITLQNYFRLYEKLAGMTGTAVTEAEEFWKIYKLDVVEIPTNVPMVRDDQPDFVYKTQKAKYNAVIDEIESRHKRGQPVLVGTTDISKSEIISQMLNRRKIKHSVLNAKQHEREALVVAEAGRPGAVTVATNMAGRGTDIVLGGNPEFVDDLTQEEWERDHQTVLDAGGLFILGSEKHEARRIDNQLRGRAGRQGDPGESRFYVALDDDLMRRFGGDRIQTVMGWAGLEEDAPLENKMVTKAIQGSQVKVEAHHFDIRKHLVEYDDVVNTHRGVIYEQRDKVLGGSNIRDNVQEMLEKELTAILDGYLQGGQSDDWDVEGLIAELAQILPLDEKLSDPDAVFEMPTDSIYDEVLALANSRYDQMEELFTPEVMRTIERAIMLRVIDSHWVQHLTSMENLRQGIGLYSYGQRDPLVMYKTRGFEQFQTLSERIQSDVARMIFHVQDAGPTQQRGRPRRNGPTNGSGSPGRAAAVQRTAPSAPSPESNGKKLSRAERRALQRMEKKANKRR